MLTTIIIVILILALLGSLPAWPHSGSWGWGPSGILGAILFIIVVLWLLGHL
jgi:hypothetical protein